MGEEREAREAGVYVNRENRVIGEDCTLHIRKFNTKLPMELHRAPGVEQDPPLVPCELGGKGGERKVYTCTCKCTYSNREVA